MKNEMKERYGVTASTLEEKDWMPEEFKEKKAPEYERKKNSALCEAFRDWVRAIYEKEDQRENTINPDTNEPYGIRYAGEETATVSPKMEKYLIPLFEYLGQTEADILEMILQGQLLYKDQLYGVGLFEGMGIMQWRFSLTPDYFVPDELVEKKKKRAEILRKFALGEI